MLETLQARLRALGPKVLHFEGYCLYNMQGLQHGVLKVTVHGGGVPPLCIAAVHVYAC
jgi:hypothetical protein